MIDIDALKFDERGLIPAIVVDTQTRRVLTLAYMSRESLQISMEKGLTCFYSRSRQKLWLKGETSGNFQHIVSITADCDHDALLVEVRKDGPACHLGTDSCFESPLYEGEEPPAFAYEDLMQMLIGRKETPKAGSYTTYLFEKGRGQDPQEGRRGDDGGHHRGQGRRQAEHHLRNRRPDVSRHGADGGDGHQP